ncbi:phage tail tube protein [Pseudescherichia sp.]|uniref:phage tail tube protein n=1 Tax=Pseudescherichia sp. TaxID=2055881 RepID=UPI00289BED45|nr:phage tail tube protein [Pseudescherichia sp.]
MAMDIFSGANLRVEVGSAGGGTLATDFAEVPEVASFVTSGFESTVIEVTTFNSSYSRKLLGTKSIPDLELKVNYLPDNAVHKKLEQLADDQKRCQIRLSYFEDSTRTNGFYVVYQCLVSSTTLEGDKDTVITKNFKLTVDGAEIQSGLLEE